MYLCLSYGCLHKFQSLSLPCRSLPPVTLAAIHTGLSYLPLPQQLYSKEPDILGWPAIGCFHFCLPTPFMS